MQMSVTAAFILYVQLMTDLEKETFVNTYAWATIPAFIIVIVTEIAILCCRSVARKVPTNYVILALFTVSFSFLVGLITVPFDADTVIQAGGATALTTLALTAYAMTTDDDHTIMGGMMFILAAAVTMIILSFALFSPETLYSPFLIGLLVIFYGLFLVYDTQLIAGKGEYKLSIDDYIIGALIIYLDIIMIFIQLLKLFGRK